MLTDSLGSKLCSSTCIKVIMENLTTKKSTNGENLYEVVPQLHNNPKMTSSKGKMLRNVTIFQTCLPVVFT